MSQPSVSVSQVGLCFMKLSVFSSTYGGYWKCMTSVLKLLRYFMISQYRIHNFWCCYSIRRLYINSSKSSKHKKALSRFSNVESLIEMFPITECRVLEACKARRVNTMLIHTSINRMKRATFHLHGLSIDYRLIL